MDRDHRTKPFALRAVSHALVALELFAQLFTLSLFPFGGMPVSSDPSSEAASWKRPCCTGGSVAFLIQWYFRDVFSGTEPDDCGPDDRDLDQIEWVHVDAFDRQKLHSIRIDTPATSLSFPLISISDRSPLRTVRSACRPIPLYRLTC